MQYSSVMNLGIYKQIPDNQVLKYMAKEIQIIIEIGRIDSQCRQTY